MAWLLSERASGRTWRVGDSDLAWEIGGYDLARFELHVLDEEVVGAPDGRPDSASAGRPSLSSRWRSFRQWSTPAHRRGGADRRDDVVALAIPVQLRLVRPPRPDRQFVAARPSQFAGS
ncbi:hypothetical protein ACIOD2_00030 [Amycolatopsis sp. NPDC088138]|uniref:hypothetical protein n=1 Tax=Amycolatopsis sp. NPDC088138 TaxID=3363938 RepID=UPI0038272188